MRSFRFRILALVLSLVTVVVAATVLAVVTKAHAEVGRNAALRLRSAADTAREVLKFRGNQLTSAVEVLTSDFGFKEAIASGSCNSGHARLERLIEAAPGRADHRIKRASGRRS